MTDGMNGGAAVAPPCPHCGGTGQRRIRPAGAPPGYSHHIDCDCAKDGGDK